MTLKDIKALLSHLKKYHVQSFKHGDCEITFFESVPKVTRVRESKPLAEELLKIAAQEQENIPPDLRADDTMNYDKILNWSGSPDPNEMPEPLPLTGEGAL